MSRETFESAVRGNAPVLADIGTGRFGAKMVTFPPTHVRGVLKFAQFSNDTTRRVPKSEMHKREVAAYRLDHHVLGFNVTPPALLVRLSGKQASISEFVDGLLPGQLEPDCFKKDFDGKWKVKLAKLWAKVNEADAVKIVLLDLLINNADRHGKNLLILPNGYHLRAIDNGMSFGPMFCWYRNVLHRYMFLHKLDVPAAIRKKLASITKNQIAAALAHYVGPKEIEYVWLRLQFVLEHVDHLDFNTLSQGNYDKNGFPTYAAWFRKHMVRDIALEVR